MKTCLRVVCIGVSLLCMIFSTSQATGQSIGDGYFGEAGFQPAMADINVSWPGRIWVQANLADEGLGYSGSYVTLGAKQHIFQDYLDGRWLLEARGHYDPEYEGFFGNLGIERVFSLHSAGAEVSTSFWIDYDDTQQADFAHTMTALGVSASIETRRWALMGNGYFPVGDSDFNQANPRDGDCFLNHSIVTVAGIDSALQGFDALFQVKPSGLAHLNGTFGLGGYAYSSDLVDSFGGFRARAGVQLQGGMIVNAELNHDARFDFTGSLQVGWLFGAGARGTEYGLLGTDLEPTIRNDHVVRYLQDIVLAIDPDTGLPYDVFHVDNTATAGGDGTFERPFDTLAAAEAASATDDIIFVREGDGTTTNMDSGIALQDGQLLLGDGVQHLIPLANGTNFILCNDIDGNRPTITNTAGDAITLANRNTVRGFVLDGSQGGMINGISGNAGSTLTDGIIEDVTVTGGASLHGIHLNDIAGDWTFSRNDLQTALVDGLFIENACDPFSVFTFTDNIASNNGRDGIHMDNFDALALTFIDSETDDNGRDGIRLENHKDTLGLGARVNFFDSELASIVPDPLNPTNSSAEGNAGSGIHLENMSGDFNFFNMEIRDNLNAGISLINITTPGATDEVFIGTAAGNSVFAGNGVGTGAGVFNSLGVAGTQRLTITDSSFQNDPLRLGGSGIISEATIVGANLETTIIDNNDFVNHTSDGIQLNASNGATHTALVTNTTNTLNITNSGGNGISLNTNGAGPISLMDATISNTAITNSGAAGIQTSVFENGQAVVQASATTINGAVDGIQITADNLASTGVNLFNFDGVTISNVGDDGIDLNILDNTFVDFILTNSNLTNGNAGDHGIEVTVDGDVLTAAIDTRLRINAVGNTISGFDFGDGIGINATGDAHVLANISANNITNNGNQISGVPTVPFSDGINLTANDSSEFYARIQNNNLSGNGEQGLSMNSVGGGLGNSTIAALVTGNNISGNDLAEDGATAAIESGNFDMVAANSAGNTMCIAMSNNLFNLTALFVNGSAPLDFVVELDGLSNGNTLVFAPNLPAFTVGTFSTVCTPAIALEEVIFAANGFPPLP